MGSERPRAEPSGRGTVLPRMKTQQGAKTRGSRRNPECAYKKRARISDRGGAA